MGGMVINEIKLEKGFDCKERGEHSSLSPEHFLSCLGEGRAVLASELTGILETVQLHHQHGARSGAQWILIVYTSECVPGYFCGRAQTAAFRIWFCHSMGMCFFPPLCFSFFFKPWLMSLVFSKSSPLRSCESSRSHSLLHWELEPCNASLWNGVQRSTFNL